MLLESFQVCRLSVIMKLVIANNQSRDMKHLIIQSISDLITNSSSEAFIVEKDDMLHYIKEFDSPDIDCFDVTKLTRSFLKMESWMSWEVKTSYSIPYKYVLRILRISEEDAAKEGLLFTLCGKPPYTFIGAIDYAEKFFPEDYDSLSEEDKKTLKKEQKEATIQFFKSWVKFCDKHREEIEEKVIGKYLIVVDDHFNEWSDFREDIRNRGYLYYESRH